MNASRAELAFSDRIGISSFSVQSVTVRKISNDVGIISHHYLFSSLSYL